MRCFSASLLALVVSATAAEAALPPDLDSDGFPNAVDNCAFLANSGQEDVDGDGIGDACACGDLSGSGRADAAGVSALRQLLANPDGAPLSPAALDRCAVFGDLAPCDVVQLAVLRRWLAVPSLGPLTDSASAQHCPAAISEHIYVATTGALGADGTPAAPMRRITDAVARARSDRAGDDLPAGGGIRIHVAPGTYTGSFSSPPTPQTEVFPILVNVPRSSLEGATVLTRDAAGLATGAQAGTETRLAPYFGFLATTQCLVLVGRTTDGGVADRASVTGLFLDGIAPQYFSCAVFVDRVSGFAIRDNLVQYTGFGVMTRLASGTIERNLLQNDGESGAFVMGGSLDQPAVVTFRGNRVQKNGHGLMAKAIGWVSAQITAGANAFVLPPIQTLYDRTVPADLLNLPDTLDVSIVGNEFSQNPRLGLRLAATATIGDTSSCSDGVDYQTNGASQPVTAVLHAEVRGNSFLSNQPYYGLGIEPAFPCSADPRAHHFDVHSRFLANLYAANGAGNALFTFARWSVTLGFDAVPADYKYVEGSTYDIEDPLGELAGFDYDNPALDPVTSAPLGNTLRVNGAEIPPGKLLGP